MLNFCALDRQGFRDPLEIFLALCRKGADERVPVAHSVCGNVGEISRAEALALGQQETRRYAKRQLTWFRNQTPDWPRVAVENAQ